MVGRLVEQQNVGRWCKCPRQCRAPGFAARKARRRFITCEPKLAQKREGPVRIIPRRHPRLDIAPRIGIAGKIGFLRQIANGSAGLREARSAIGLQQSRGHLQ